MFTYRMVRKIGEGGFGEVYAGYQNETGGKVAIKFLNHLTPDALERFRREARILMRLSSSNVTRLIDFNFRGPRPFIVLEYCEYGSLQAWVTTRRSVRSIVAALTSVTVAMNEIHGQGGFHRDIKPSNILLQRDPQRGAVAKLGDFGLARTGNTLASNVTHGPYGTAGYMAPEVSFGRPFDWMCDVYSLGITGIELLTGGKNPLGLFNHKIPADLRSLLISMVHVDPDRRPNGSNIEERMMRISHQLPPESPASDVVSDLFKAGLLVCGSVALAHMIGDIVSRDS